MSVEAHRAQGPRTVTCAIVTVSDTRTPDTDRSGQRIRALVEAAGHHVGAYTLLPDDPVRVRAVVAGHVADPSVQAVLVTGGTGLGPRDTTYEAVLGLLERRLDGFGELFRMLSFAEIGPAAMLSRAMAGASGRTFVATLPGSTAAVELALTRLLLPELVHIVGLLEG